MGDKNPRRHDVPPAEMAGTEAEVVLLAIALCEEILAEPAGLFEAVAADIQEEADAGRDLDDRLAVRARRKAIDTVEHAPVRRRLVLVTSRIAQDRGVVRERRDRADIGARKGCPSAPLE